MTDALIIVAPSGQLPRRAIDFIRYAPTGVRIAVKRMSDEIAGCSIDSVIVDDPLAQITGETDDQHTD